MTPSDITACTGVAAAEQTLSRAVNRRSMLRGIGITGLGALLGPILLPGDPASAATPNRAARRAAAARGPADKRPATKPTGKRAAGASGIATLHPTPYNVTASCELSDEYFMTDQVPILAGDQVLP